jgi:hypothetical protein
MYAYSMAAAHEELPHLQLDHYMVSNVESGGEGWDWIDALENVCVPPNEEGIFYDGQPLPLVIHFCQTYRAGDLSYSKRQIPKDIFSCESPLLVDPPRNLADADYFYKKSEVSFANLVVLICIFLLFLFLFNTSRRKSLSRASCLRREMHICYVPCTLLSMRPW